LWLAKSEPTVCDDVEFAYTIGPPPEYFGSRPYWNEAVVGSPSGFADPEKPTPVPLTNGAPVSTDTGEALIVAESVTVEVPKLLPTEVIATEIG
jgi:hypothetical protein